MAIPQVTFGQYQDVGFAGQIYDSGFHDTMSYSAGNNIPFGTPLILGTNKERQVNAVGTGAGQAALVVAIAAASHTVEAPYPQGTGAAFYTTGDSVPSFKDGRIWVQTSDAVVAGATANLTLATSTFTDEAVATGIEAFTQLTVKFITGTTAAGLAVVEIAPK
jgi:hypothetical protein